MQDSFSYNDIRLHTISNEWMELSVSTLGCTVTSINIPGKDGVKRNIVLNYAKPSEYLDDAFYVGSTVGRVAGRISNASFTIDGHLYHLTPNDGSTGNHLHGGINGFNKKEFHLTSSTKTTDETSLKFYYKSIDGEEGYPGSLELWVTVTLTNDNKIIIQYRATADKKTHVNLTNHTYFNFTGLRQPATDHELYVNADSYVETDNEYIPTGAILPVTNSVYDFRERRRIDKYFEELKSGYNECFVLNRNQQAAAILFEPVSGIRMTVTSTAPGLLLYTGDFLHTHFIKNQGICLETQFFPDSPNHEQFPSTLLGPGEEYLHHTVFAFDYG